MPSSREKKEKILKELKEKIKKSNLVAFINFHGLNTSLSRELRSILKKRDSQYLVAKKTLIKKAFEGFNFEGNLPSLEGEVALVFANEDPIQPLKCLKKFAKEYFEIRVLGGLFEEKFLDSDAVLKLAELPSKEVLIAQFINLVSSPLKGLVGALGGVQRNFINILFQLSAK